MSEPAIVIVQDSREQRGYSPLFQTPCVTGTLTYGDYSIAGLEHLIAVERKSLPDLLGSVTQGRERFETELKRARSLHRFFLLIEASPSAFLVESFGSLSRAHPRSVWGTLMTWSTRYHPVIFGQDRETAAKICEGLLVGYAREFHKTVESMGKATKALDKAHRLDAPFKKWSR
ncbi:MAG: ERCC4 domain-containing protein [Desulfomonile tiedjei]|nr:ERCC4 domain-containing protein [Desulfomonile tiedjei]